MGEYLKQYGFETKAQAIEQGFLREPNEGLYEWYDPELGLKDLVTRSVERQGEGMSPRQKKTLAMRTDKIIKNYMERPDKALDPKSLRYNLIGEVRAFESLGTLLFSGVASIPELAVAFVRAKGELNLRGFASALFNNVQDFSELREFAEAMGTVDRNIADVMLTEMYTPYASEIGRGRFFRRALPYLFRYNMNEPLVNYTRMVSTQVAVQFISQSSVKAGEGSKRHERYLEELGLDQAVVRRWLSDATFKGTKESLTQGGMGQHALDAEHVRDGINRFVNESVLRPSVAERPTWANHPLGTFIFHLKTFAYSFNKNVLGGLAREVAARHKENPTAAAAIADNAALLAPGLLLFMLFGAMSDELRNRIKSFGAEGSYEANDEDWTDMVAKWADRTGLFTSAPFFDPIYDTVTGDPSASSFAFGMGPTTSHLYDLFGDGEGISGDEALKSLPLLRQIPALRGEGRVKETGPERWMYSNMVRVQERKPERRQQAPYTARVIGVLDGDTVEISLPDGGTERVRLFGIDTAESSQPGGDAAGAALKAMILGKNVAIHSYGKERHGRNLARILLGGKDINAEMLRTGHAWYTHTYADEMPAGLRTIYAEAANRVKGENKGVWADEYAINPQDWRAIMSKYKRGQ
ncbi:thermonuclease family protein [Kineobactrum salinum]|uniref:TNase-like domain-containing protein n=1 Tax=Kineobactrum salinum TaxID=2708301 RepID=A0A6C0U985_9GAMM|nr:thermonuclease family protein [Kineobactrum salinum]QIB67175.1 hypothetical protein G3T16_18965 [Kineobactrum salinum]